MRQARTAIGYSDAQVCLCDANQSTPSDATRRLCRRLGSWSVGGDLFRVRGRLIFRHRSVGRSFLSLWFRCSQKIKQKAGYPKNRFFVSFFSHFLFVMEIIADSLISTKGLSFFLCSNVSPSPPLSLCLRFALRLRKIRQTERFPLESYKITF